MLRTMNLHNDDHVRHLIDQRSARTDLHSRYPSVSEYSVRDTPSVYSTQTFSPSLHDRDSEINYKGLSVNTASSQSYHRPRPAEPRSPMSPLSDRELLNDPSASGLDLEEDYRSSYASSNAYDEDDNEPSQEITDVGDDSRMSMLGPKMRFHGRAPWEMGEEPLDEGDESDSSGKSRIFGSKRSRGKGDGITKGFGVGAANSRPSLPSRPSYDSSRTGQRSKGSFETIASNVSNSQGALHALAQASMSSSSLALPPNESSGKGSSLRNKFSMPRIRPRTPSNFGSSRGQSPLPPSPRSLGFSDSPTTSEFSRASSASSPRPSTSPSVQVQEYSHPYANPNLVISYSQDTAPLSPKKKGGGLTGVSRSDSISTITDSHALSSQSTLKRVPSASSLRQNSLPSSRVSHISGKDISSPLSSVRSGDLPPQRAQPQVMARPPPMGPNGIPGWMDNPGSPTIQLISLAEAQAQAKERARSNTANGVVSNQSIPFPDLEQVPSPTNSSRSRARSISAGAKAKSALSNMVSGPPAKLERGFSEPSPTGSTGGKQLKHKKSGFMKLFGGGEREAIPPVPTLSDAYTSQGSQLSVASRAPKISLPRVPVPTFSSLDESPSTSSSLNATPNSLKTATSKRTPPPLHIVTSSQAPHSPAVNLSLPTSMASARQLRGSQAPATAPPATADFPSLSLRPVSTIFSAHFTDHIVKPEVQSPVEEEISPTPSSISPGTGRSPVTPGFPLRSDTSSGDKASIALGSEDQSAVIQALQEQIISAKKTWQRHIWELEGQVRDLKAEVQDLRAADTDRDYCEVCGRGQPDSQTHTHTKKVGIVDRPRARTGDAARFGSGK